MNKSQEIMSANNAESTDTESVDESDEMLGFEVNIVTAAELNNDNPDRSATQYDPIRDY